MHGIRVWIVCEVPMGRPVTVPSIRRNQTDPFAPLANLVFDVVALGNSGADIRLTPGADGNGFCPLVGGTPYAVTFGARDGRLSNWLLA